jgi:thiol:disulfide interchange protein
MRRIDVLVSLRCLPASFSTRVALAAFAVALVVMPSVARSAEPQPAAAEAVVAAAVKRAAAEKKAVLIEFGASWCGWCRAFAAFVSAPDAGPIIAAHYVVANLTVEESDDKKALENPGGAALKTKWGGAKAGLPFYVFLNGAGEEIADSNAMPDGTNIGFPAVPAEDAAFMALIDKTAPGLSAADRQVLDSYLRAHQQK